MSRKWDDQRKFGEPRGQTRNKESDGVNDLCMRGGGRRTRRITRRQQLFYAVRSCNPVMRYATLRGDEDITSRRGAPSPWRHASLVLTGWVDSSEVMSASETIVNEFTVTGLAVIIIPQQLFPKRRFFYRFLCSITHNNALVFPNFLSDFRFLIS